ncbi:helicase-related protein [Streptomyces sp. CoH17]|uniref:helicase-related protein n=1 Tax=Streptomyces sp. CoH17 TaxID=2992806 RepID=UPI00226D6FD6|nr:helicase-related protein [Streptomyces sp. CoH17]
MINITNIDELKPYISEDVQQKLVVVEESPRYAGQLVFQTLGDEEIFYRNNREFISRFMVLTETNLFGPFVDQLEEQGYQVFLLPSANQVLAWHTKWISPLTVEGLKIKSLHSYQQYGLRKAFDPRNDGFFFFNWSTGAGKTIAAAAGAQELIANRGEVDLCIIFTLRKLKINHTREINKLTELNARTINGLRQWRHREYAKRDAQVYVMNYEKPYHDFAQLSELVRGKSVLFVMDEVQKVLGTWTRTRKYVDKLIAACDRATVWPMSASVINNSPERYHAVFDLAPANPLGSVDKFRQQYVRFSREVKFSPHMKPIVQRFYDEGKLEEVRHRVAAMTHTVRKTDPGVREYFKGVKFNPIFVQMSDHDRRLYDRLAAEVQTALDDGEMDRVLPLMSAMRWGCNTFESFKHTKAVVPGEMVAEYGEGFFDWEYSSKYEMILDDIETIRSQGDKCVVFTHWTNLSLKIFARALEKRKIKFVMNYGVGMSDKEAQKSIDTFKSDPEVTVFLSSDAGSHGLNFQEARYVLNVECPSTYDVLMQRNSRIDRADSYLDGLECRIYVTEDSVEERIWKMCEYTRKLSSATQGTEELLDRPPHTELDNANSLRWVLTGKE